MSPTETKEGNGTGNVIKRTLKPMILCIQRPQQTPRIHKEIHIWTCNSQTVRSQNTEKSEEQHKRASVRLTTHFSSETKKARRQWDDLFKVLREDTYQPRIFYPMKRPSKNKAKLRHFEILKAEEVCAIISAT